MNNKPPFFIGALIAAVVCIGISIYYIVPGYDHLLVTHDATHSHPTHAFAFFALAVICIIGSLITRPKSASASTNTDTEKPADTENHA